MQAFSFADIDDKLYSYHNLNLKAEINMAEITLKLITFYLKS